MTDREKLIALLEDAEYQCDNRDCEEDAKGCEYLCYHNCWAQFFADHLLANGVVVREKGEWERVIPTKSAAKWSNKVTCSVCHRGGHVRYNFCPNCGADMTGGDRRV